MEVEQKLAFLREWLHEVEQRRREAWDEYSVSFLGEDIPVMRKWETRVEHLTSLSVFTSHALLLFRRHTLSSSASEEKISPPSSEHLERAIRGALIFIGREDASFLRVGRYIFVPSPFGEEMKEFLTIVFAQYGYYLGYGSGFVPEKIAITKDA